MPDKIEKPIKKQKHDLSAINHSVIRNIKSYIEFLEDFGEMSEENKMQVIFNEGELFDLLYEFKDLLNHLPKR